MCFLLLWYPKMSAEKKVDFWLLIAWKKKEKKRWLFYTTVPVCHTSVTVSRHTQHLEIHTNAATWNSATIILYLFLNHLPFFEWVFCWINIFLTPTHYTLKVQSHHTSDLQYEYIATLSSFIVYGLWSLCSYIFITLYVIVKLLLFFREKDNSVQG